jgi:uncharacterized protein YdhG (YjbR/CyaY superfamily)
MRSAPEVTAYIDGAEAERKGTLTAIRGLCADVLDGFDETMEYGMPSYMRDGEVEIAFANQKRYISLYILRQSVLDAHRPALEGVNLGKGCVRYSSPRKVDLDIVRSMLEATAATRGPIC